MASRRGSSKWGRNRGSSSSRSSGPSPSARSKPGPSLPLLPPPVRDRDYIVQAFNPQGEVTLKQQWEENPKAPLSNYISAVTGSQPTYEIVEGLVGTKKYFRCTVLADQELNIVGEGDAVNRKDSEKLAALSACIQLQKHGVLENLRRAKVPKSSTPTPAEPGVVLSDGSGVTYERARQFMDYYCRRFGFGKPDITFEQRGLSKRTSWEATMTVGGRRIGLGSGNSKKEAQSNCYIDVTQYLESCDPELWKAFVEAAAAGKDGPQVPKVQLQMSDSLDEEIRDLCSDIRKSTLYKNRPNAGSDFTASDAPQSGTTQAATQVQSRHYEPPSARFHTSKSERLLASRNTYLADPRHEPMRHTREALPIYTKAADILSHISANDVTICMAATGSGKTTQVPQIILDDWIQRGEGSRCNIVCTQPRRIAAISVAERVARERGELVGRGGSVGYQVRFEAKLPAEHGCITFCTTGIFLKRMQSALFSDNTGSNRNLDDVTHVIVDEVHERDVDTDLLLVVLKRLLADRKARGKPIKIILMSATVDATLFQQYFLDESGQPAKVVEVPGRAFPVERRYLDDIITDITRGGPRQLGSSSWVFSEKSVVEYVHHEMSPNTLTQLGFYNPSVKISNRQSETGEDLELPYPLIALVIAYVLKQSDSGHVLVFLPGWDEIQGIQRILNEPSRFPLLGMDFNDGSRYAIHILHSTIPVADQQAVFEPPPQGVRRIILATNIAETSITIPDVVYVVDSARVKEKRYDPDRHLSSLVSAWVGSSNLTQRAGRAGRHRPGEYYGIITRSRLNLLRPHQLVEMKRVDLSNVVMHVKALNFPGMEVEEVLAEAIEPPAASRVQAAMANLEMVGALDANKNLTSLGKVLLQLPVEAAMGRLVLYGSFFRCLDSALTLAAIMTNRDPFLSPPALKKEANAAKDKWTPTDFRSDILATLFAYNEWWAMQSRGDYHDANRFCGDNFLSKPTLLMIQKIKEHLLHSLYLAGVIDVSAGGSLSSFGSRGTVPPQLNINGNSLPLLAALIAIGSQPNFAIRASKDILRTSQDRTTFIHPSSVCHRKREGPEPDPIVVGEKQLYTFQEKSQNVSAPGSTNAQTFLKGCTRLDPMTYILFGAYQLAVTERGFDCDGWLPVIGNIDALDDVQRLKTLLESCMLRVFEGIGKQRRQERRVNLLNRNQPPPGEDNESDDEDDQKDQSLSDIEIKELDYLTRDVVRILEHFSEERVATQSRRNSRPGSPMTTYSPLLLPTRLPGGSRSGYSTPYNIGSAYNSRPGTPSLLRGSSLY